MVTRPALAFVTTFLSLSASLLGGCRTIPFGGEDCGSMYVVQGMVREAWEVEDVIGISSPDIIEHGLVHVYRPHGRRSMLSAEVSRELDRAIGDKSSTALQAEIIGLDPDVFIGVFNCTDGVPLYLLSIDAQNIIVSSGLLHKTCDVYQASELVEERCNTFRSKLLQRELMETLNQDLCP